MLVEIPIYSVDKWVKYIAWDLDAFSLYYVAGGTETAATYNVTDTSISFVVSGGFYAGTTTWLFTNTGIDTFNEFMAHLKNKKKTNTKGFEGEWVVGLTEGAYGSQAMATLATVTSPANCFGVANQQTFQIRAGSMSYISYIKPAVVGRKHNVYYVIANTTFASGTTVLNIYDNETTTLISDVALTTVTEKVYPTVGLNFPIVMGTAGNKTEVRITHSDQVLTGGYLIIGGTTE